MKFKYYGRTFTGSREEIIESLKTRFTEISQPFLTFNRLSSTFRLGEEEYLLSESEEFNVDAIRRTMVQDAIAKVPLESNDPKINIESLLFLKYLFIDNKQLASQTSWFTIDQILEHCDVDVTLGFDTKIEIEKSTNHRYVLHLNNTTVLYQSKQFTLSQILYQVVFFNRINQ